MRDRWVRGPLGVDADRWVTRAGCRTVLVLVPSMTAGNRLRDLLLLLDGDHRVQVLFTVPDVRDAWHGVEDFVRAEGGLVIPWQQALHNRFDLVLAAATLGVDLVHGPLLVIPHGAGSLMSRKYSPLADPGHRPHRGLARETLTRKGRVLAAAIVLTHETELAAMRESCPEAVPRAVLAGDICHDRMLVSRPFRSRYRAALGVTDDEHLVVVSSTWSPESTFGRHPELCRRLRGELGGRHRLALVLHPNVWAAHGRRQVLSWLAGCPDDVSVIPPEEGWRATVIAGDSVVGDYGSTTQYAAAIGKPVALAAHPEHAVRTGSLADAVARMSPVLDMNSPLAPQVLAARADASIADLLTSRPGQAAELLRATLYRLLDLPEPGAPARVPPVPPPSVCAR